jgi:hypothetical protein
VLLLTAWPGGQEQRADRLYDSRLGLLSGRRTIFPVCIFRTAALPAKVGAARPYGVDRLVGSRRREGRGIGEGSANGERGEQQGGHGEDASSKHGRGSVLLAAGLVRPADARFPDGGCSGQRPICLLLPGAVRRQNGLRCR